MEVIPLGEDAEKVEVVNQPDFAELRAEIQQLRLAMAGMTVNIDGKRAGEIIFSATPGTRIS